MKAYWKAVLSCFLLFVFLTGCSRPIPTTPNPDEVSTQVNKLLTSIPAQTQLPSPVITQVPATSLPAPATATSAPMATQKPATTFTSVPPTATATLQQTPNPVGTPTAPVVAGDPRSTLGTPTLADKLDSSQDWALFEDEHVKMVAASGSFELTAKNADGWHSWALANPSLANFYIEATEKTGACTGKDSYGLMVRAPDFNQGYLLGFSCDGMFKFQRWDGSQFTTLTDWTQNSAIKNGPDQTNRLGVMADGSKFTFYANGIKVGETSDATYAEGRYGLFISASQTPNFSVTVDEVDYWTLP